MDDFFDLSKYAMPRIGQQAPAFRSVTTQGSIYFPADYVGKWVVLFSYPTDFTPSSFSEMMRITTITDDFKAINCELIGFSVEELGSYIDKPGTFNRKKDFKGIKDFEIKFPLVQHISMEVAKKYGMIQPDERI